ncbi:MAG: glycosyltransferase family 39 protein [Cytophagales bacterium]|nr:glycosyltransferase family 39 protein [Cytophagales bacterium]
MIKKALNNSPQLFLLFWLVINLIQAAVTETHNDESYYWIYTQQLQWGYFDHPPMVALVIDIGYSLFQNEFGLRLVNVLLITIAIGFFFKMVPKDSLKTPAIYLMLLAVPFLNYLGFLVFPDGPLIAFGAAFLFYYQQWLKSNQLKHVFILGFCGAAMLYSKYHAGLFFVLIVLSNLELLRNRQFYLITGISLLLFLPHIWWQYQHDFPSIRFHLIERSSSFELKYALRFVGEQLLAVGPVLMISLFIKTKDQFERALAFMVRGFFVFFLFSSLRGVVHIQWTSLAWLPAIYLVTRFWNDRFHSKWWYALLVPHILLTLLFRLYVGTDLIPGQKIGPHYVKGQKEWYNALAEEVGDRPVIFLYDLKEPSAYTFYTGKPAIAIYPDGEKKSQYDLWQQDKQLDDKTVVIASKRQFDGAEEFNAGGKRRVYLKREESY